MKSNKLKEWQFLTNRFRISDRLKSRVECFPAPKQFREEIGEYPDTCFVPGKDVVALVNGGRIVESKAFLGSVGRFERVERRVKDYIGIMFLHELDNLNKRWVGSTEPIWATFEALHARCSKGGLNAEDLVECQRQLDLYFRLNYTVRANHCPFDILCQGISEGQFLFAITLWKPERWLFPHYQDLEGLTAKIFREIDPDIVLTEA